MPRPRPYRLLTLGVFTAFAGAAGGALLTVDPTVSPAPPAPLSLLAAAHANPAEVGFQDTLRAGETLSQLLLRAELAEDEARAILAGLNEHQDPRRLRPGSVISYRRSFVGGSVRGMELRIDADRTLNMQRSDGEWTGSVEEVPVRADTVVLTGTVESSLYAALLKGEGSGVPGEERERVADKLADKIFAWQIDFSRDLRSGDSFRILYERMARPDGTARDGRVLAVQFNINGRDHEAYAYRAPNGEEGYYDRQGESLRRAFLRAPLEFRRISSAFSRSRFHPILKTNRPHHGIDYAASTGTPVRAVGDAVVARTGWSGGYGNLVELRHSRGYSTKYAHLQRVASGIRPGVRIKQGDLIGYVGSTGMSTAPHLHYEFHVDGRPVNPNTIKFVTGEPVARRYRSDFQSLVSRQLAVLDRGSEKILLADGARTSGAAAGD
ncbi:peptidoglycan DD-metalloendopeptidase family protein [soil metagenome]